MSKLAEEILRISAMPDVRENMRSQGLIQRTLTLAEFDKYIADEMRKLSAIVRDSGIQPE